MTAPKNPGGAGSARQVRLMDLTRLETKVDQLTGEVTSLRAEASDLRTALNTSPFAGISLDAVTTMLSFVAALGQPGGCEDYVIKQRATHVMRGIQAMLLNDDSLLQDKPRVRGEVRPGAVETPVQLSDSETASIAAQVQAATGVSLIPPQS